MAVAPTKTLVVQAGESGVPVLAEPVRLVNPDGSDWAPAPAGGSTPATGSVTPAALSGYDPGTGHSMVPRVKSDGSGFDFVALPFVPAAPTADTLTGATDTGRAVLKAANAAAARTAIGAGTSSFSGKYTDLTGAPTIPAAPTWANISGKPASAAAIADIAADGTVTPATVNAILAALRGFGVIAAK